MESKSKEKIIKLTKKRERMQMRRRKYRQRQKERKREAHKVVMEQKNMDIHAKDNSRPTKIEEPEEEDADVLYYSPIDSDWDDWDRRVCASKGGITVTVHGRK